MEFSWLEWNLCSKISSPSHLGSWGIDEIWVNLMLKLSFRFTIKLQSFAFQLDSHTLGKSRNLSHWRFRWFKAHLLSLWQSYWCSRGDYRHTERIVLHLKELPGARACSWCRESACLSHSHSPAKSLNSNFSSSTERKQMSGSLPASGKGWFILVLDNSTGLAEEGACLRHCLFDLEVWEGVAV